MKKPTVFNYLFVFIVLSIFSCEKEVEENKIDYINSILIKSNLSSSIVNLEDIPEITDFIANVSGVDVFEKKGKEKRDIIFSKLNITKVSDSLGKVNYSIPFIYDDSPENIFYNLIVPLNSKGKPMTPFVLQYKMDENYIEQYENNGRRFEDFTGEIGLLSHKDFFKGANPFGMVCETRYDQYGDPIPCDIAVVAPSGGGGAAQTGGGAPSSTGGTSPFDSGSGNCTWYMEATCSCHGELVGVHDHTEPALIIDCSNSGVNKSTLSSKGECDSCYSTGASGAVLYPKSVLKLEGLMNYNLTNEELSFLSNYSVLAKSLVQLFITYNITTSDIDLLKRGLNVVMTGNGGIDFNHILNNRTSLDLDAANDLNNNSPGGYDTNEYDDFNSQQVWPSIGPIIPVNDFIGWNHPGVTKNCMDYAKAQIAKKGYSISNYGVSSQTIQVYKASNGSNTVEMRRALSYLSYALQNDIPVIVGVDTHAGSPNPLTDNTTDHFVVIVGMGQDNKGKFFLFYDNASGLKPYSDYGASNQNKLYYDSTNDILTGTSNTPFSLDAEYPYIVTMIRKSK